MLAELIQLSDGDPFNLELLGISGKLKTSCNGQVIFFTCVEMCYIFLHSDLHMSYLYITLYVYVCLGICFHWEKMNYGH